MNKKKLVCAMYINENSSSLSSCLNQLAKFNSEAVDIWIYLDNNSRDVYATIENFFQIKKPSNFTLIKNGASLSIDYCFNDVIKHANSQYVIFVGKNNILTDNFFEVIEPYLDGKNDVISFAAANPNIFYDLDLDEYKQPNTNLLLGSLTWGIYNKVFNLDFLRNNEIYFENNKWYPDYFLFQVLFCFKLWKNLTNNKLVAFRKNYLFTQNVYDFLFQIDDIDSLANHLHVYEEYKSEIEFWYVHLAINKFLPNIFKKYKVNKLSNNITDNSVEIRDLALQNVHKKLKLYCPNLSKNPYYKQFKKIFEVNKK